MRVLVLWADGKSANLGVRVLAEGAKNLAHVAFGADAEVIFQDLGPNEDGFRVSTALIKQDLGRPRGPIKEWLRQFDLVLDTGAGDSFTDIYGRNRLARITYTQLTARRIGIPLVLLPQTFGPFTNFANRLVAARSLKRSSLAVARDSVSADYARQLGRADVMHSTDLVFSLPVPKVEKQRDVVLNVSGLLWGENRHIDAAKYRRSVRELLALLNDQGRSVSFVPHVLANSTRDNDMVPLEELGKEWGASEVRVPDGLSDARDVLASANVVIGARMHACLNALAVGTPAIPWAYSRKFKPLLDDVGWSRTVDLRSESEVAGSTMSMLAEELSAGVEPVRTLGAERIGALADALKALVDA